MGTDRRLIRHVMRAGRHDAHIAHDAIQDDVGQIAVVGNTGKAAAAQEGVEAPIGRLVGIDGADVTRAQEFPSQGVDVRIGQQRWVTTHNRHAPLPSRRPRPSYGDQVIVSSCTDCGIGSKVTHRGMRRAEPALTPP
jgi:hypothetical protein